MREGEPVLLLSTSNGQRLFDPPRTVQRELLREVERGVERDLTLTHLRDLTGGTFAWVSLDEGGRWQVVHVHPNGRRRTRRVRTRRAVLDILTSWAIDVVGRDGRAAADRAAADLRRTGRRGPRPVVVPIVLAAILVFAGFGLAFAATELAVPDPAQGATLGDVATVVAVEAGAEESDLLEYGVDVRLPNGAETSFVSNRLEGGRLHVGQEIALVRDGRGIVTAFEGEVSRPGAAGWAFALFTLLLFVVPALFLFAVTNLARNWVHVRRVAGRRPRRRSFALWLRHGLNLSTAPPPVATPVPAPPSPPPKPISDGAQVPLLSWPGDDPAR